MLEVKKQGVNEYGLWLVGTLDLGIIKLENLMFNTNLKDLLPDTSKPIKIKRVKIFKGMKSKELGFTLEF